MSEIRDGFIKFMDADREGIAGYMSKLSDLLEQHDPVLWDHLEENKVQPTFYALKWVILLFT